jgi:hypothetical protein
MLPDLNRLGLDLWPSKRAIWIEIALTTPDGKHIHITDGEAETIARNETERTVAARLKELEANDPSQTRPKQTSRPNCWLDWS